MRKALEYVGIVALLVIIPPVLLYLFMAFCLWSLSFSSDAFDIWRAITAIWIILVFMYVATTLLD